MSQLHLKHPDIAPPFFVPTCLRCGAECLVTERECFSCQLEMEQMIAEDLEMETE